MTLLLFVPGVRAESQLSPRKVLEDAGAGNLMRDDEPTGMTIEKSSPSGDVGILYCWDTWKSSVRFGIFDDQTWHKSLDGNYWFGWDRKPGPSDLQKKNILPSSKVKLSDGNTWWIPIAASLPRQWGLDETGAFIRRPKGEFQEFCERAEDYFQIFINLKEGDNVTWEAGWHYLAQAVGFNYRTTLDIINKLELFDDETGLFAIGATLSMNEINEALDQKKTEESSRHPHGSDSMSGKPA